MIDTIVLPTDGSSYARTAADHAVAIAREYDATLHVLTVVEAVADDVTEDQRYRARQHRVEPLLAHLADAGVETTESVAAGVPVEEILASADELGADLLAMGTHGRTGLERFVLGSVTERVLRESDVPVLVVPRAAGDEPVDSYGDVLVPTDGSEGAAAVWPLAFDLAGTFDATLHGVSVVEEPPTPTDVGSGVVVEQFEALAEDAVADFQTATREAGLEGVRTAVLRGTPHQAIDNYAETNGIDLVVMGTHGRTGLDRYLLGSVTENLIRTTAVPVLATRAPEPAE